MRFPRIAMPLAVVAAVAAWPSHAEVAVDQENPLANFDGGLEVHGGDPFHYVAQTFTVGKSGRLVRVDLPVTQHRCTPAAPLKVEIVMTAGGFPGSVVLAAASLEPAQVPVDGTELVTFDLGAGIDVVAGDVLGIAATTEAYSCNYAWHGEFNGEFNEFGGDYAGGATWCFYGQPYQTDACWRDMGFRTWVSGETPAEEPPPLAEPAVDQENPLANLDGSLEIHEANADEGAGRHFVAQTFTVGKAGWLTRVDLPVTHHRCTPTGTLFVDIVRTVDGIPGQVVLTGAAATPGQVPASGLDLVPFDFAADAIPVAAGDVLGIAVTTDAAYPCNYAWHGEFNGEFNEFGGDYPGGATWCFYGSEYQTDACWRDMGFRTWVAEAAPPDDGGGDDPVEDEVTAGATGWPLLFVAVFAGGLRRRGRSRAVRSTR